VDSFFHFWIPVRFGGFLFLLVGACSHWWIPALVGGSLILDQELVSAVLAEEFRVPMHQAGNPTSLAHILRAQTTAFLGKPVPGYTIGVPPTGNFERPSEFGPKLRESWVTTTMPRGREMRLKPNSLMAPLKWEMPVINYDKKVAPVKKVPKSEEGVMSLYAQAPVPHFPQDAGR
jgi:hypothetical protein